MSDYACANPTYIPVDDEPLLHVRELKYDKNQLHMAPGAPMPLSPSKWLRTIAFCAAAALSSVLPAHAGTETVMYAFKGGSDGAHPYAPLYVLPTYTQLQFWGTTKDGGEQGAGTVFVVVAPNRESVVYSFKKGLGDAVNPIAGLTRLGGPFYGTTPTGGANGTGAIFTITKTGADKGMEAVFYSFPASGSPGQNPMGGLTRTHHGLCGTTGAGGQPAAGNGFGTVFCLSDAGTPVVRHVFTGGRDGAMPNTTLTTFSNNLYGTTLLGGGSSNCVGGCGTEFLLNLNSGERILGRLQGGADGAHPRGGGVTADGGSANCLGGCGTVTSSDLHGNLTVLHAFQGGADGAHPLAGLVDLQGLLYGTTYAGGAYNRGTIYSISPTSGVEKVLYSFRGGVDGAGPRATLILLHGTFYGTTERGGGAKACSGGCGTVFSFAP